MAPLRLALPPDPPAVVLDDLLTDRQAQAGPFRLASLQTDVLDISFRRPGGQLVFAHRDKVRCEYTRLRSDTNPGASS